MISVNFDEAAHDSV